jgi:pimeloyl-[acyl-carrier protein] methyl ester esterase
MFRFVDRRATNHLVVVPGWAFDHRIFSRLELPFNYHLLCGSSLALFEDEVRELVSGLGGSKISLLGWSKGAFAVCEFASRDPESVEQLLLVGVRRKYEEQELDTMRMNLERNRAACLKRFYRQCFAKEEMAQYERFKRSLLDEYLEALSMEQLTGELDWLGHVEIRPADLQKVGIVKFIHGGADAVAPIEQARALADAVPQSELIVFEQAGHAPFLRDDFARRVNGD